VSPAADLDEFVVLHKAHRALTPTVGELTPNGYRPAHRQSGWVLSHHRDYGSQEARGVIRAARRAVLLVAFSMLALGFVGCYDHRLDTLEKHCDHLMDVSLEKYKPFWSVFTVVSFHNDKVLDSLVVFLNETHIKKFEGRIDRAVWREGSPAAGVLHVTNPSGFFVIEPE